jgi:hypothetical protein
MEFRDQIMVRAPDWWSARANLIRLAAALDQEGLRRRPCAVRAVDEGVTAADTRQQGAAVDLYRQAMRPVEQGTEGS